MRRFLAFCLPLVGRWRCLVQAQSPYESAADFAKYAMKLREQAMLKVEPQVFVPTSSRTSTQRYPWKTNIVTTVFWIGEQPTQNNPVPNTKSSWDANWSSNYGGYDTPDASGRGRITSRSRSFRGRIRFTSRCRITTSRTDSSNRRRRWSFRGLSRTSRRRGNRFARAAGSRSVRAIASATRNGRIAGRSAPITSNTFSKTSGRSRI